MALDLETLRVEIESHLKETGTPIFYGFHRMMDTLIQVTWDTRKHADFREFVAAGKQAGARIMVFHYEALSLDQIDEALDQLEVCELTREEKRNYETRLRQLQAYEGFTSSLHLSFAVEGRLYVFELLTEWYEALQDILIELDAAVEEIGEAEDDDGSVSGYYSKN